MFVDFKKTFFPTPEQEKELKLMIEKHLRDLTKNKCCCVCANSHMKDGYDLDHHYLMTYCSINNCFRDYQTGENCPNWEPQYSQFLEELNEQKLGIG